MATAGGERQAERGAHSRAGSRRAARVPRLDGRRPPGQFAFGASRCPVWVVSLKGGARVTQGTYAHCHSHTVDRSHTQSSLPQRARTHLGGCVLTTHSCALALSPERRNSVTVLILRHPRGMNAKRRIAPWYSRFASRRASIATPPSLSGWRESYGRVARPPRAEKSRHGR